MLGSVAGDVGFTTVSGADAVEAGCGGLTDVEVEVGGLLVAG